MDRAAGETGFCGSRSLPAVSAAVPHFGEEPPLTGRGGAGTIFFYGCNLRCVYCQNHQISQSPQGSPITASKLARLMLDLARRGCSTIEPVSPTHHLPGLLEALAMAVDNGLKLPFVYNTNGYETPDTLDLLDGIVDVYLPDLKYSLDENALMYSGVDDYVGTARSAILKMHSQVGNLVVDLDGKAVRGLIVRHLMLPGDVSGTADTLVWIRENLPTTVTVSLMAQYSPRHRSAQFPTLHRTITHEEYDAAVDLAWEMGLENVFVQDFSSQNVGLPDFTDSHEPFGWD